jgi:RNA polymerase sigma-70 factor, ECF subfamily
VRAVDMVHAVDDQRVPDDGALLRAHVEGDPTAFTTLVRRHQDRLWAVALRTLSDREEAADALQEALISAYRSAHRFRGDSAVTTWLHRIVVNACLDRVRRRSARPTVPLLPEIEPVPVAPVDSDTAMDVRAALAQLPVEQRAALVLVEVHGYAVSEAATILGVAEGTVKSRCARGRARLAALLGYLRNPPPDLDVPSQSRAIAESRSRTPAERPITTGEEGR